MYGQAGARGDSTMKDPREFLSPEEESQLNPDPKRIYLFRRVQSIEVPRRPDMTMSGSRIKCGKITIKRTRYTPIVCLPCYLLGALLTGYIGIFDHGSIFEESLWLTACLILLELLLKVVLFARVIVYPDRRIVKVPKLMAQPEASTLTTYLE